MGIKELSAISKDISVLYVEDDHTLLQRTEELLSKFFDEIYTAKDGEEAFVLYKDYLTKNNKTIDLVISDLIMPNKNGIELSKNILTVNEDQYIIITSAYNESEQLIELINIGVKYFLNKPFNTKNFVDVLLKICKKIKNIKSAELLNLDKNYIWDHQNKLLKKDDQIIKLTKNEKTLLEMFLSNPNQVFADDTIFNTLYFDESDKDMSKDSVKSIIKRLRKKLPEKSIVNIYGDGYKINLPQ